MLRTILTKTSIPISFSISWLAAVDCWVANKLSKGWSQCLLGSKQKNHLGTVSRKRVRRGRKFPSRFAREGRGGCQGGGRAWGWQPLFFLEIKNFFIKISPTLTMMVSLWRRRSKGVLARPLRHVARLVLVSNLRHSDRGQGEVLCRR